MKSLQVWLKLGLFNGKQQPRLIRVGAVTRSRHSIEEGTMVRKERLIHRQHVHHVRRE